MNQPSSFAAIVTFAFNKRQLVWAAEDVTLVGLREDGLIHRGTPSAGEKQDKETRQINESKFAAVFAAERQLVHEEKRDAEIDRQNEPQPQCKQGKVRQHRVLFGSEDLLEHGISRLRLAALS